MSQYHAVVAPALREWLNPRRLGSGLQICAQYELIGQSLIALLSDKPGNMPADLGNSTMVGRWAGQRIAFYGDYAEPGDMKMPILLDDDLVWDACQQNGTVSSDEARLGNSLHGDRLRGRPASGVNEYDVKAIATARRLMAQVALAFPPKDGAFVLTAKDLLPDDFASPADVSRLEAEAARNTQALQSLLIEGEVLLTDIAPSIAGLLEGATNVRFCKTIFRTKYQSGHIEENENITIVPVRPFGVKQGDIGVYELNAKPPAEREDWLRYLERMGISPKQYERCPGDGSWHGIPDKEIDLGQNRLIVNLDKLEYINPLLMGEVATTAGLMQSEDGAAGMLGLALVYPEHRGTGDMDEPSRTRKADRLLGRWRGDRILVSAEQNASPDLPNNEEVRAGFTDVTQRLQGTYAKILAHERRSAA